MKLCSVVNRGSLNASLLRARELSASNQHPSSDQFVHILPHFAKPIKKVFKALKSLVSMHVLITLTESILLIAVA